MADERVQRRLAAILAADVVGYSRLMGQDEAETLAQLKALRDEVFDPKVAEYGGRIVKLMGDGILIEFPSAVDAVQHAIDVQQATSHRNESVPEDRKIELRIGINVGDVIVDGDDIYGDGVNIAARLESFCEPARICVSLMVHEAVRGKLDIKFNDLGEQSLKNIAEPVRVFSITPVVERADVETGGASNPLLRRPAVAVLPFVNLSGDAEQEYFADGLTEDIITALSSWRFFPVIARNSTFAYKGKSPDIRQVGEELGARYVIEGSVRKVANRVRVTAQLINADTGHHVWADRFDRDLQDIFELQDELTGNVASIVAPELVKAESKRSGTKRPESLDAWDYCQRGKSLMHEISKSGVIEARNFFNRAIELEPNFIDAWCGLAHTYHRELFSGFSDDPEEGNLKILEVARRAVALDEANSDAHFYLSFAYMNNRRTSEAIAESELAVELNPTSPSAQTGLGTTLTLAGRPEEGVRYLTNSIRLNPRYPRVHLFRALLARAHLDAHQYEEARDHARQAIQRGRVYLDEHLTLASALGHLGRRDEAKAVLDDREEFRVLRIADIVFCPWWQLYDDPEPNKHLIEGLRKAGLPE